MLIYAHTITDADLINLEAAAQNDIPEAWTNP